MTDFAAIRGEIWEVKEIAAGLGVRDRSRLRRLYGGTRWPKMKGISRVRLHNGDIRLAELLWYEAHGVGRKEIKRKRYLD